LFICFEIVFCTVDVKKEKKRKKDKTMIEKEMCVFLCIFFFMYVIESKKKMNLIF